MSNDKFEANILLFAWNNRGKLRNAMNIDGALPGFKPGAFQTQMRYHCAKPLGE
jgi:hypothetical protein